MADQYKHRELIAELTEGVSQLTSSEQWERHLQLQSRFHRYSFGNAVLIATQRPEATMVAGYNAWKKMNRCVSRGEKAIWILAPMVYKRSEPGGEESDKVIRGFKAVPVFDVSQTEGEDLPVVCARLDGDDPSGTFEVLLEVAGEIGFAVVAHEFDDTTNGDCSHRDRLIRIERRNSPAQKVKTLAHELAHALLHESFDSRARAELEAESTAYIVCASLGIDSGEYSFGYVATWAGGGEEALAAIKASGERIQATAAGILRRFEASGGERVAA